VPHSHSTCRGGQARGKHVRAHALTPSPPPPPFPALPQEEPASALGGCILGACAATCATTSTVPQRDRSAHAPQQLPQHSTSLHFSTTFCYRGVCLKPWKGAAPSLGRHNSFFVFGNYFVFVNPHVKPAAEQVACILSVCITPQAHPSSLLVCMM
jgi:hypothetical protein